MSTTTRIHCVTFLSPGSFVSEQSTHTIETWDTAFACEMATQIVERRGAKPYAFYFTTSIGAPDVPDGLGGFLKVEPREVERSGMHHLGGVALTVEDVERGRLTRAAGNNEILLSNMRNNWPIVVENRNGFIHVSPFNERDVIVDTKGAIVERGDTLERIAYRALVLVR